jgi:hypothetical protein
MTDAEIQAAATQMEKMGGNPAELVPLDAEQVKNMSPEDILQGSTMTTCRWSVSSRKGARKAAPTHQLDSMTPQQLKQQAEAMRRMTPQHIRKLNPQLASLTDKQIWNKVCNKWNKWLTTLPCLKWPRIK